MNLPWLTILALLPALGAVVVVIAGPRLAKQSRWPPRCSPRSWRLIVALRFSPGGGMQLVEQVPWIRPLGAYYALGLDGIGLTLVLLVVIVTPVVIIASWRDFDDDLRPEPSRRWPSPSKGPAQGALRQARVRCRSTTPGCSSP